MTAASRDSEVLCTAGLTKRFRGRVAVCDLSLSVRRGDVYGFLGPNGAGKTTTLRMIVGLVRPTSGHVTIAGHRLTGWNRAPLGRLGASIEAPAFYDYLSGRDNLRMLADLSARCPPRRIDEVLDRVGMRDRAGDKVGVYSHGMKQRLAIAAALLPRPELVLLDEPTNGLDPMGIHDMRELIRSLARDDGYTILLSSHLLVEVQQICNRGAIVALGRKLWEGEVADLLGTRQRIRLRVTPLDRATEVLRRAGVSILEPSESEPDRIHATGDAQPEDLVDALVAAGCRVREVLVEVPSLEEVFLELVQKRDVA